MAWRLALPVYYLEANVEGKGPKDQADIGGWLQSMADHSGPLVAHAVESRDTQPRSTSLTIVQTNFEVLINPPDLFLLDTLIYCGADLKVYFLV